MKGFEKGERRLLVWEITKFRREYLLYTRVKLAAYLLLDDLDDIYTMMQVL